MKEFTTMSEEKFVGVRKMKVFITGDTHGNFKRIKVEDFNHVADILKELRIMEKVILDLSFLEGETITKTRNFLDGFVYGSDVCTKCLSKTEIMIYIFDDRVKYAFPPDYEMPTHSYILSERDEVIDIAKSFLLGKKVEFNIGNLNHNDAKYVFDFLSGVAWGLSGNLQKLKENVYVITPSWKCLVLDDEDARIKKEVEKINEVKQHFEDGRYGRCSELRDCYENIYATMGGIQCAMEFANNLLYNNQHEEAYQILEKEVLNCRKCECGDEELIVLITKHTANWFNRSNRPAEAEKLIKHTIKKLLPKGYHSKGSVELKIQLRRAYRDQGLFHKETKLIEDMIKKSESDVLNFIELQYQLASSFFDNGKYKKCIPLVNNLIKYYEELEESTAKSEGLFILYHMLSKVYYRPKDISKRVGAMEKMLAYELKLGKDESLDESLAIHLYTLADEYMTMRKLPEALKLYDEAEKILRKIDGTNMDCSPFMKYVEEKVKTIK